MYSIPTGIMLQDKLFPIRRKGDYRVILDCFSALNDIELRPQERTIACLMIFYDDLNSFKDLKKLPDFEQAVIEMHRFFNCGEDETVGGRYPYRLVDWDKDSQLICAAVNKVTSSEIRSLPYMHWWTFMGHYMSIGDSLLAQVVSIRYKIVNGTKLEKHEQKFKRDNPQYFIWEHRSIEEQEDDAWLKSTWNSQ